MNFNKGTRSADATPHAASLIEGLRDFGYSLETSLADIIDNSITAGATRVDLLADPASQQPWISVVDNGLGMTEHELIEAMRPGSQNPRDSRDSHDLGRFGLGLKSASFSQCRALYVVTRKSGQTSCAAWDLDEVSSSNKWSLALIDDPNFPAMEHLTETGTAVIWKKLDRLDGGFTSDTQKCAKTINEGLVRAEKHLRLVFHRYLEGENPRLKLFLNNRRLQPIDPFASNNRARQADPSEEFSMNSGSIRIQCVTLPHKKKMSKAAWDEVGGRAGHLKSQGLYIYRTDRLIIAGNWLGLAKATELTKLCRVCVDIPNSMDAEWKIDVKKASAQLPPLVRQRLRLVVEHFVSTSKRTYRRRGQVVVEEQRAPMWNRTQKDEGVVFAPNVEHPVFQNFQGLIDPSLKAAFLNCLHLLASSLPIETLYADMMASEDTVKPAPVDELALTQQIHALIPKFLEQNTSPENMSSVLKNIDVIRNNWELSEPIINQFLSGIDQ